jgi:hypothetical protein
MYFILKVKSEIRGEKDGIRALKKGKLRVALIVSRERGATSDERERAMRHER